MRDATDTPAVHDRVAGLLLAAGASRRLGEPKQLLTDGSGIAAVVRMTRALHHAGCTRVFVVVGASREAVVTALAAETVELITNDAWADGMGSSIAAGVRAVRDADVAEAGLLICPCDMPSVDAVHLRRLTERFDGTNRVASGYRSQSADTVHGIPAILPRADWPWLASLTGDAGARPLLREAHVQAVPLADGFFDLDTPADVERWRASGPLSPSLPQPERR